MKAMQIEYPESWTAAAGSTAERFENETRMALAMKLFEMRRLAAEFKPFQVEVSF